jgi:FixJ family two-component response regulator
MKLGAADYLAKPFTDDDLIEAVEKACTDHWMIEEELGLMPI